MPRSRPPLATIGYQPATVAGFLEALRAARIELLVDVRAVASSRRPGFAKSRLAATLAEGDIGFEADPAHCHRSMVADAVRAEVPVGLVHLRPADV